MNEAQWLACEEPRRMLDYLEVYHKVARTRNGRRKLRLFACACCRQLWHLAEYDKGRRAVEVAERYADGLADKAELRAARETKEVGRDRLWYAAECAVQEKPQAATDRMALYMLQPERGGMADGERIQCALIRELFGNPFRPVFVDPAWQTWNDGIIVKLAQSIYGEQDYTNFPILADMLEDGGGASPEVLGHCRAPGPHARGCWVVDLLLGRH